MTDLPDFLLKIFKPEISQSGQGGGGKRTFIIVQPPYAHLEAELTETFKGQPDVMVITERRKTNRRSELQPVATDRRRTQRRRQLESIIDVVISPSA